MEFNFLCKECSSLTRGLPGQAKCPVNRDHQLAISPTNKFLTDYDLTKYVIEGKKDEILENPQKFGVFEHEGKLAILKYHHDDSEGVPEITITSYGILHPKTNK